MRTVLGSGHRAGVSILALAALTIGVGAGAPPKAANVTAPRLAAAAADPANWMTHGGTYAEQRYANLDQNQFGQRLEARPRLEL